MEAEVAAAVAHAAAENPYGLAQLWKTGGLLTQSLLLIMGFMSLYSWFIILTKWWDQQGLKKSAAAVEKNFWTAASIKDGIERLKKGDEFRFIAEDGLRAASHHDGRLTDRIDLHEWVTMSLQRATDSVNARLNTGLSFLATVGSTSPFVGLLGTVIGILRALLDIGTTGQPSIDRVAGPVGEALIMTAIGLAVAVPAVLGYNWLLTRNKVLQASVQNFASDLHAYMLSGARVDAATQSAPATVKK